MRPTILAAIACAVTACTGTAITASSTPSATQPTAGAPVTSGSVHPPAVWATFDANAARTGVAAGLPAAGALSVRWNARLDGAVYGQPLVVGDDVIAATENDSLYALDRSTGKVVWERHLGTPVPRSALHGCGDIFPLGITGTPVYDPGDGLVYAVADTAGYHFTLYGLSAADGAVEVARPVSLATSDNNPAWDQQRTALTLDDGRVYAGFGGLAGDCGPYVGSVVGIPVNGKGSQVTFFTPTTREGAVWGTGGPVVGPGDDLWIAIGNGAASSGAYDGSDSVTELTPELKRAGLFAPSTWADDNANDRDLGSTQPALAAGNSTLILGKRGEAYLLDTTDLGGIGGQRADLEVCAAFGAAAVDGDVVYEPCRTGPLVAISVNQAKRQIRILWDGPAGANGSPVVGGGAVWVTAYTGSAKNTLYELNPASGRVKDSIRLPSAVPDFSSLSLGGATAFVSTLDGVTAVNGA
ncbi:MAG TPA: PQQ-binding-like beta-propeller repeat protein [Trebonia sp.]|jgi:outer membrane protein assembly factor BamB|nr:PQQ-binding-like beta-propeller repeat protein [Trebonia sp.]